MKNIFDLKKIENFVIIHQKKIMLISLLISVISALMFIFCHTEAFGYNYQISENIANAIFIPFANLIGLSWCNNDKLPQNHMAHIFILLFLTTVLDFGVSLYCFLIKDISPIGIIICFTPLLAMMFVLWYSVRDYFKQIGKSFLNIVNLSIKLFMNKKQ